MTERKQLRRQLEIARQQLAEVQRQVVEARTSAAKFAVGKTTRAMLTKQIELLDNLKLAHERSVEDSQRTIREIEVERRKLQSQSDAIDEVERESQGSAPWDELEEVEEMLRSQKEKVDELEQAVGVPFQGVSR